MVLLDFCAKKFDKNELVVAHFDHGTRESSKTDADFVEKCCKNYNIDFYRGEGQLGEGVSEEKAREKRYEFLKNIAKKEGGTIFTAHHLDDLVESVTINFLRGTGWRGLAVLNNPEIERPLISWTRKDILKYAAENEVIFREDPTNSSENYLRNRIRKNVRDLSETEKRKIFELRQRQVEITEEVLTNCEEILRGIRKNEEIEREFFRKIEDYVAIEIIYALLKEKNISLTRPQMKDFLAAIREYGSGKKFNLPKDRLVELKKNSFVV